MSRNYWVVKQEPEAYSWADLLKEGQTVWTGVRNFQARKHLRAMSAGDPVLFYHSGKEKQVVGLARVTKESFPDPTATEGPWLAVELAPVQPLTTFVPLNVIKADKLLQETLLAKQPRLSVSPLTEGQFQRILELGETTF